VVFALPAFSTRAMSTTLSINSRATLPIMAVTLLRHREYVFPFPLQCRFMLISYLDSSNVHDLLSNRQQGAPRRYVVESTLLPQARCIETSARRIHS
jgi:hypothetical protein